MRFTRRALVAGMAPLLARAAEPLPTPRIAEIEKLITEAMSAQRIPGLSIAIATQEKFWTNGYGFADVENYVPAKASSVFRTASIAKPVTGVAAMQLVERGKLDLDAPVQKYVPAFPLKPWPVTTRQLLGHLAGIRTYNGPDEFYNSRHYVTLSDALQTFWADPLLHAPGTRFVYSTLSFVAAGHVLEQAAGVPFGDLLRRGIFGPAGMTSTAVDDPYAVIPNRARWYRKAADGEIRNAVAVDNTYKVPGGGLCSTSADVARFAMALDAGILLKPASIEELFRPQVTTDGKSTGYGLGWGRNTVGARRAQVHDGGQSGVTTVLRYLPDEHAALAIMMNLENADITVLPAKILEAALG